MKKKEIYKLVPYTWFTDNNDNFIPPINYISGTQSRLEDISQSLERASSAMVWDPDIIQIYPFSNTVPLPRLDWAPRKGLTPNSPDFLIEDKITNYLTDESGGSVGETRYELQTNPNNSSSILFDGLTDPLGKQFACNIFWFPASYAQPSTTTSKPFVKSTGNFKPDSGFGLSVYIKQNESSVFNQGNSDSLRRLKNARYYALALATDDGNKIQGVVWDWATKTLVKYEYGNVGKTELRVQECYNGWYRIGFMGLEVSATTDNWEVHLGYVMPDTTSSGGWRYGPDWQFSVNGLWFGFQLETGNQNGNITSLVWARTGVTSRATETVHQHYHDVEQPFEKTTQGILLFFRFKYPFNKALTTGNAKVGITIYNAATGSNANFMGFSVGDSRQLRAVIRSGNSNVFFSNKAHLETDFLADTEYGADVKEDKYISLALIYNPPEASQTTKGAFYVNGVLNSSQTTAVNPPDWSGSQIGLAFKVEFSTQKFYGRVNEFSMYDIQNLSDSEQDALAKKLSKNNNPLQQ